MIKYNTKIVEELTPGQKRVLNECRAQYEALQQNRALRARVIDIKSALVPIKKSIPTNFMEDEDD